MIPVHDNCPDAGRTGRPWTTYLIIALTAAVFIIQQSLPEDRQYAIATGFGIVPAMWSGPISCPATNLLLASTALTAALLHGGVPHLVINMLYLWVFGDDVERRLGGRGLTLVYATAGMSAAVAHSLANPLSVIPAIGASGAIAGVLGAYVVLFPRAEVLTLVPTPLLLGVARLPALLFGLVWVTLQLLGGAAGGLSGGVSWWAHVGGVMAGVLIGLGVRRTS